MRLSFENRDLGQRLGDGHGGRPIDNHTQGSFRPMLTEQHHRLPEIGIVQCRRGDEQDAFTEWSGHESSYREGSSDAS